MEEVGVEQPTPRLYKPGLFEAMDSQSEQSYAEEKPSQSQFDAGKPLRWRHCQIVSGSLEHQFCMSFSLQGSRYLGEQDHISHLALQRCNFEHLSRNKEASPTEKRPGDVGKSCAELRYQPACLWFDVYFSFQICICVYGRYNSFPFLILSLNSQMVN